MVVHIEGGLAARACVPPGLCCPTFNAKVWLETLADLIGGKVTAPKGQDAKLVVNMKVGGAVDQATLDIALLAALEFADTALNLNVK